MKIVIDNNIITKTNIEIIKNTNIFEQIKKNKMQFYASAKLFDQLIPFLIAIHKNEGLSEVKYYIDFLFDLIGNNRIFTSCIEISQKELANRRGNYQFISCAMQKNLKKENLYNIKTLEIAKNKLMQDYTAADFKNVKKEILEYADKNYKLIEILKNQSFNKINENITKTVQPLNFDTEGIQSVINIVIACINETTMTKEQSKEQIYTNLFELLQEFNLLAQLKEQNKLITNKQFFKDYYKNYYTISFTKTMLKTILYGYSYKVINKQKSYDDDWANDGSYVSYTYFADALLTNDGKFMKDMFENTYGHTKKIFTLNEFITLFC